MEALSQGYATRARRPWTDEDQRQAEGLRAEGLSYYAIGKIMGRQRGVVQCRLDPVAKETRYGSVIRWREANPGKDAENRRRWAQANPAKDAEGRRRWREANRERDAESSREWYWANREHALARQRRWHRANPGHRREYNQAWYDANKDWVRDYKRQWRDVNRERVRENNRRRECNKRAARRCAVLPLDPGQIEVRLGLFGGRCVYCGSGDRITIDHVLALTAGGLDEAANVAPACLRCNSSKRERPVEEWYRRQPFFSETRWRKIQRHCPGVAAGQLPLALLAV